MPANNTTDSLTITAVLSPPPGGNCVVTLQIYNNTGGSGGGTGAFPQNSQLIGTDHQVDTSGATTNSTSRKSI